MWKKQERNVIKKGFWNQFGQMDSGIHWNIILQEVRKNLGMFHHFELFRAERKCKSQPLLMKQQNVVPIESSQF